MEENNNNQENQKQLSDELKEKAAEIAKKGIKTSIKIFLPYLKPILIFFGVLFFVLMFLVLIIAEASDDDSSSNTSSSYIGTYLGYENIKVTVLDYNGDVFKYTDSDGNEHELVLGLYDYVLGVIRSEYGYNITDSNREYFKAQIIAITSFLLARNGYDGTQNSLSIRSGTKDQVFCSIEYGCHAVKSQCEDITRTNGEITTTCAIGPGPDPDTGKYDGYYPHDTTTSLGPLSESQISALNSLVDEIKGIIRVDDDGNVFSTQYRSGSSCTNEAGEDICTGNNIMNSTKAIELSASGKTYEEILDYFYTGKNEYYWGKFTGTISSLSFPLQFDDESNWRIYTDGMFEIGTAQCYSYGQAVVGNTTCSHYGIDFPKTTGEAIMAYTTGVVVGFEKNAVGYNDSGKSYGNYVCLGHDTNNDGVYEFYTWYGHMSSVDDSITQGAVISAGQLIGRVGSTGNSTGPHLHFEVRDSTNATAIDPAPYLDEILTLKETSTSTLINSNFITCNYSEINTLNVKLKDAVNSSGYATREGVVAALKFLAENVPNIPYFWGGGHGTISSGISTSWGCNATVTVSGHETQTAGTTWPNGLDCSGLVTWGIYNGGYTKIGSQTSVSLPGLGDKETFITGIKSAKPGDILWKEGHVGILLEVDLKNETFTVMHETNPNDGIRIDTKSFGDPYFTHIILMDSYYSNDSNR